VVREREPELQHAEQEDQDDRQRNGELNEALASLAGPVGGRCSAAKEGLHRIGSIRIELDLMMV
jgi:hypothetical protein